MHKIFDLIFAKWAFLISQPKKSKKKIEGTCKLSERNGLSINKTLVIDGKITQSVHSLDTLMFASKALFAIQTKDAFQNLCASEWL